MQKRYGTISSLTCSGIYVKNNVHAAGFAAALALLMLTPLRFLILIMLLTSRDFVTSFYVSNQVLAAFVSLIAAFVFYKTLIGFRNDLRKCLRVN